MDLITSVRVYEGWEMGLQIAIKPSNFKGLMEFSGCLRTNLERKQIEVLGAESRDHITSIWRTSGGHEKNVPPIIPPDKYPWEL